MEQNYDKSYWNDKKCPQYDCRKGGCKCGTKRVFLPAALGDDSQDSPIAPKNGAYCNAIVIYEASGNIYFYSQDGVPTLVEKNVKNIEDAVDKLDMALAKESLERKTTDNTLQNEIDAMKNAPDVVDIVATYADLQSYSTSSLGDKDVIRVIADETHNGDSSYYRWNSESQTWTYISSIHIDERAFKPFPSSVNTSGTTQQFLSSILALHPETGMAYLGTVSLSDMPAGLTQEEVEVYIYSDYVAYAVMRSTDVAPYQWWCSSYNYGGWRPVGGGINELVCYVSEDKFFGPPGTTTVFYREESLALSQSVKIQEIYDAAINGRLKVIVRSASSESPASFRSVLTPIEFIYPLSLNVTTMTQSGIQLSFFSADEDNFAIFSSHDSPTGHEFYNGPLDTR